MRAQLDERWNGPAARLLDSLLVGSSVEFDPALEKFLRQVIVEKAARYGRQLGERAQGIDPEDIVQRVFVRLFEHPPDRAGSAEPMRRLLAWVHVVSRNHLHDLTSGGRERLGLGQEDIERLAGADPSDESRYAARQQLSRLRPVLEKEYPLGLPLLDLLLDSPHAASQELATELGTSPANIDQMRSRIRRVLRRHLGAGWRER